MVTSCLSCAQDLPVECMEVLREEMDSIDTALCVVLAQYKVQEDSREKLFCETMLGIFVYANIGTLCIWGGGMPLGSL